MSQPKPAELAYEWHDQWVENDMPDHDCERNQVVFAAGDGHERYCGMCGKKLDKADG